MYSEPEMLLHKKMWDVVNRDKEGISKPASEKPAFVSWCKRVAAAAQGTAASSAAAEHARNDSSFRRLTEDIFAHDLTPEQMRDPKYELGKTASREQRSFVNHMLRKNLGDARVAMYIFNHGVPQLLDAPLRRTPPPKALLQNMLAEFVTWHSSLSKWLLAREEDPNMPVAHQLSDPNLKPWRVDRQRRKRKAERELRQGLDLAALRDSGRKRFQEMSATGQRLVQDFDSEKLKRRRNALRIQKPTSR